MDQFMEAALEEARTGAAEGGIPIGAALVDGEGRLVATGRNRRVQDRAVVMHAEINCLYIAGKTVGNFAGMTMYSTLMPCNMCAGAIVQFGITKVIVGESCAPAAANAEKTGPRPLGASALASAPCEHEPERIITSEDSGKHIGGDTGAENLALQAEVSGLRDLVELYRERLTDADWRYQELLE